MTQPLRARTAPNSARALALRPFARAPEGTLRSIARTPEFGQNLSYRAAPVTPRELYCALFVEPDEKIEYLEPAFRFAEDALSRSTASGLPPVESASALVAWARDGLELFSADDYGSSWPVRLAREFAPSGLSDGCWLTAGLLRAGTEDGSETEALLREQVRLRCCAAGARESQVQRYGALLASLGVPVQASSRWEFDEAVPCADISYEHALLGLTLGAFPSYFGPESVGLELWIACVGPCPLLERVLEELRARGATLAYFEPPGRARAKEVAVELADRLMAAGDAELRLRVVRGFCAAQLSYQRWDRAMRGANVPYTPRGFVLEGIRRKARFAIDHHHDVKLKGHNLAELLRGGGSGHELLLDHLAETASLIRKGAPNQSPFMTHTLALEGPMFDAFTAEEKNDLREWIASLGRVTQAPNPPPRVELSGSYGSVVEAADVAERAAQHYASLGRDELLERASTADHYPGLKLGLRVLAAQRFSALAAAFETDDRLRSQQAPHYAEGTLGSLIRLSLAGVEGRAVDEGSPTPHERVGTRDWLRGVVDVVRLDFEEHGWLLQRYLASERPAHGVEARFEATPWLAAWELLAEALSTNVGAFLPEILGLNLAFEVLEAQPTNENRAALACASFAIHAFMGRVVQSHPADLQRQWQRVWRAFRLPLLLERGSAGERAALLEHLAPTQLVARDAQPVPSSPSHDG
jgi:hypothetical protein